MGRIKYGDVWVGILGWEAWHLRGLPYIVYIDDVKCVLACAHTVCLLPASPLLHQTTFSV